jgi:hypothetical protein
MGKQAQNQITLAVSSVQTIFCPVWLQEVLVRGMAGEEAVGCWA